MNATDVNASQWKEVVILFDNEVYSRIAGKFSEGRVKKYCLGERWNKGGKNNVGFPHRAATPMWEVVIDEDVTLIAILNELKQHPDKQVGEKGFEEGGRVVAKVRIQRVLKEIERRALKALGS